MDSREPLRYNKTHFFHLTTWPLMSSAFFSLFKQVKIAQFLAQELCSKEFQTLQLNVANKSLETFQVSNHLNIFFFLRLL